MLAATTPKIGVSEKIIIVRTVPILFRDSNSSESTPANPNTDTPIIISHSDGSMSDNESMIPTREGDDRGDDFSTIIVAIPKMIILPIRNFSIAIFAGLIVDLIVRRLLMLLSTAQANIAPIIIILPGSYSKNDFEMSSSVVATNRPTKTITTPQYPIMPLGFSPKNREDRSMVNII